MTSTEVAGSSLKGREQLLNLLEDCLKGAPGDAVELVLEAEQDGVTRYANNRIHQNVWQDNARLWVRVIVGGARASLLCNSLDPLAIRATIEQTANIARMLPKRSNETFAANTEDSGANVEPGAEGLRIPANSISSDQPSQSYFEATARQTPAQRAQAIEQVVDSIKAAGFEGFGTYKNTVTELAVANSLGLRAHAASTLGFVKVLVESATGAGYADLLSRDASQLNPLAAAEVAIEKCSRNINQRDLPPGDYPVILEPNAVADMVRFMVIHGCGATSVQDGRSFMTDKFGQTVTGANINLWEDPNSPHAMPFALDYDGLQSRAVPLVIGGKAAGVVYDRETAARAGNRTSTGHANHPDQEYYGTMPNHLVMTAGTKTIDELVAGMKRGLLVTRLHYTHCPDPRRVVATGTTRDGTFLIENGAIVAAVKNLRFTQSVLELLSGVEEFGQPKTCQDWWAANGMGTNYYYLPALHVAHCTFNGATTF